MEKLMGHLLHFDERNIFAAALVRDNHYLQTALVNGLQEDAAMMVARYGEQVVKIVAEEGRVDAVASVARKQLQGFL